MTGLKQHLWPQGSVGLGSPRSRDHRNLGSAAIKPPNCSSQMTRVQIQLGVTGAARTPRPQCRALQNTPKNSTGCLPTATHLERGQGQGAAERGAFGTRCVLSPRRGWCGCERSTAVPVVGCAAGAAVPCWLRRRQEPEEAVARQNLSCLCSGSCLPDFVVRRLSNSTSSLSALLSGAARGTGIIIILFYFFLFSPSFMEFGVC